MAVQLITHKKITKFDLTDPNFKPPPQPEPEEINGNVVVEEDEDVYGESTTKYYEVGFRVNGLILFNEPEITQDEFGADENASIEMYFQRNNLSSGSLNFYPEMGDIVDWNEHYWEINGTTEPQLIAGHPGYKHSITATAHRARLSSLQIEERPR